jgi:uncharacterized membrane protein YoaK (UPF0700 family)
MTRGQYFTAAIGVIVTSAMACQYALLRPAIPGAISTAVMTGNLTDTVLSLIDLREGSCVAADRLKRSLRLLFGFLLGCVVAACVVALLGDWVWSFPVALAAAATLIR